MLLVLLWDLDFGAQSDHFGHRNHVLLWGLLKQVLNVHEDLEVSFEIKCTTLLVLIVR